MSKKKVVLLVSFAALALLVVVISAQANIPEEHDYLPEPCIGPCMGSNDTCCDPGYGDGSDGGAGGGSSCSGLYCQYIPEGPNGEPSEYTCASGGGEWDATYNQCSGGGEQTYCDLTDPCSVN